MRQDRQTGSRQTLRKNCRPDCLEKLAGALSEMWFGHAFSGGMDLFHDSDGTQKLWVPRAQPNSGRTLDCVR